MKKILFVCTGNTCRSSMAKAIFEYLIKDDPELDYIADSAGTSAAFHWPASINAIKALEELGIDLNSHLSKQITKELLKESSLILTMTDSHKSYIINAMPEIQGKVYTLKEYANKDLNDGLIVPGNIMDPYGGDMNTYRECRDEIHNCLKKVKDKLKRRGPL